MAPGAGHRDLERYDRGQRRGRVSGPDRRPAAAYIHANGDVIILSSQTAAWLFDHTNLRSVDRPPDPKVEAELAALMYGRNRWLRTSSPGSNSGRAVDLQPEVPAPSEVMTTGRAANLLRITDRAVRLACAQGRLPARQVDGRWQITRADLDRYTPARERITR
jgi:excisionase family DNA binding protein